MESNTDYGEWKLEVERVLPQLKVTIRTDNKVQFFMLRSHLAKVNVLMGKCSYFTFCAH